MRLIRDRHAIPPAGDSILGREMHSYTIAYRGVVADPAEFVLSAAEAVRMTPVADPVIFRYPTPMGQGGVGETVFLPIAESFIAVDAWPALGGGYMFVNSCREFTCRALRDRIGDYNLRISGEPRAALLGF